MTGWLSGKRCSSPNLMNTSLCSWWKETWLPRVALWPLHKHPHIRPSLHVLWAYIYTHTLIMNNNNEKIAKEERIKRNRTCYFIHILKIPEHSPLPANSSLEFRHWKVICEQSYQIVDCSDAEWALAPRAVCRMPRGASDGVRREWAFLTEGCFFLVLFCFWSSHIGIPPHFSSLQFALLQNVSSPFWGTNISPVMIWSDCV